MSPVKHALNKAAVILFGSLATIVLGGWEGQSTDQIAQKAMIGLSKSDILACLGKPDRRAAPGEGTEIWTYVGGRTSGYGPGWAIGLNTNLPPYSWPSGCEVNVVMTTGRVSQVGYAAADGGEFPLGQECVFPVTGCAKLGL